MRKKEQIEKIIGHKIRFGYEFKPFWDGTTCKIEETESNYNCMYYSKPTWSNKSGFLGGVSFVKSMSSLLIHENNNK